jgi:hypothetical protein
MGKQHSECALCGKTIVDLQEQESSILKEVIDGTSYPFVERRIYVKCSRYAY